MHLITSNDSFIPRRTFLRGLGTLMSLPLFEAMMPRKASAAATSAARRMVCIYTPNGCNVPQWTPQGDGADYQLSPTLQPLKSVKRDVTVITGLHHPNEQTGTHNGEDTWLTAAKLNGTPGFQYRNSISADQLAAEVTGKHTRFPSLEISTISGTGEPLHMTTLAWTRNAIPLPAENNPRTLFDRLFAADAKSTLEARHALNKRQQVLMDAIQGDAKRLRAKLGSADQSKLDEYLTSVEEVERRIQRAEQWLNVPKPVVDGKSFETAVPTGEVKNYLRLMYDLIVLALQTDSTRVVTFSTGRESGGFAFREIGINENHHQLSHYDGDEEALAKLGKCDSYLVEQVVYFIERLKATRDGDATLLDRTMALYGSGMSINHSKYNLPTLFAGGSALGLRQGQHLDLGKNGQPYANGKGILANFKVDDKRARMSNLLTTMLHKMDVPLEKFVDATGEVSELTKA